MRERIGPLPACMQPTPLWNSWRCSQVIFHPLMKVSYIITVPIAAHIEVKSVEKTGMIRVSRYKRQKAPAEQVPHGSAMIQRIFEVNPLQCIKCGGNMRVVAFITDYQTSKKILKHIGEETISFRFAQCKHCPPPLRVKTPTANIPDTAFLDSIPSVEVYFQDTEYAN